MKDHQHTNELIDESSPYLLQHAHNPVNWHPWGEKALNKAKAEDKPMLISIGYSSCHWCHVMEHESFEDTAVAEIMNEHFVCIKVDREERPDIDQVYMEAVQLMTGQGGWPLNCFALPDGRPFYGGTYFPRDRWTDLLKQINSLYRNEREKVEEYAQKLTEGVKATNLVKPPEDTSAFPDSIIHNMVSKWKESFDPVEGGPNRAPKFPLPNNYGFLLQYAITFDDQSVLSHVELTLDKMARGGIFDQLGGGFARYSTDVEWKVPHFEKMLYDNAQLLGLYAQAYRATKYPLYKEVVEKTIDFLERDLMFKDGIFYSALDADSEGEEGKYYVWTKEELGQTLGDNFPVFRDYYNVNEQGFWEEDKYILMRTGKPEEVAEKHGLSNKELQALIAGCKQKLLKVRQNRVVPGLDDKSLTSWNALALIGYTKAYKALGRKTDLETAQQTAKFILETQRMPDGGLYHNFKKGKSSITGYLEDYCFAIEGLTGLYECTFDEEYLKEARALANYTIDHFFDERSKMFFFTSSSSEKLIARKIEYTDNVVPATNSSMAKALYKLGHYFYNQSYLGMAEQMLHTVKDTFKQYPPGFSNWGQLYVHQLVPFFEIAITGKESLDKVNALTRDHYLPNAILMGDANGRSTLQLLENKYDPKQTTFYVCVEKSCRLPVHSVEDAVEQMITLQ